jgi:hypothetical protein
VIVCGRLSCTVTCFGILRSYLSNRSGTAWHLKIWFDKFTSQIRLSKLMIMINEYAGVRLHHPAYHLHLLYLKTVILYSWDTQQIRIRLKKEQCFNVRAIISM